MILLDTNHVRILRMPPSERLYFVRILAGAIAAVAGARAESADPLAAVGELLRQLDHALATVSRQRDILEQLLAERTAALADATSHLALVSRRPEAAALRFVARLRRVRRAVLPRAS